MHTVSASYRIRSRSLLVASSSASWLSRWHRLAGTLSALVLAATLAACGGSGDGSGAGSGGGLGDGGASNDDASPVECVTKQGAPREAFRVGADEGALQLLQVGDLQWVLNETDGDSSGNGVEYSIFDGKTGDFVGPQQLPGTDSLFGFGGASTAAAEVGMVHIAESDDSADEGTSLVVTFVNPAGEVLWQKNVADGGRPAVVGEDEPEAGMEYYDIDSEAISVGFVGDSVVVTNGVETQALDANTGESVEAPELPDGATFWARPFGYSMTGGLAAGDDVLMSPKENADSDERITLVVDSGTGQVKNEVSNVFDIDFDGSLLHTQGNDSSNYEVERTTLDGDTRPVLKLSQIGESLLDETEQFAFCGGMTYLLTGDGRVDIYETDTWKRTSSFNLDPALDPEEAVFVLQRQALGVLAPTAASTDTETTEYVLEIYPSS